MRNICIIWKLKVKLTKKDFKFVVTWDHDERRKLNAYARAALSSMLCWFGDKWKQTDILFLQSVQDSTYVRRWIFKIFFFKFAPKFSEKRIQMGLILICFLFPYIWQSYFNVEGWGEGKSLLFEVSQQNKNNHSPRQQREERVAV